MSFKNIKNIVELEQHLSKTNIKEIKFDDYKSLKYSNITKFSSKNRNNTDEIIITNIDKSSKKDDYEIILKELVKKGQEFSFKDEGIYFFIFIIIF